MSLLTKVVEAPGRVFTRYLRGTLPNSYRPTFVINFKTVLRESLVTSSKNLKSYLIYIHFASLYSRALFNLLTLE